MARISCVSSCSSFIILLVALSVLIDISYAGGEGSLRPQECAGACNFRCSETQHRNPCIEFCNKCCANFALSLILIRGNQREKDRERAQARTGGKGKNKDDGLTPEQRRERDGKALQEKAAKKAAQGSGAGDSGGGKGKTDKK
ncbi:hypothetical protein M5689_014571 [Euphorbia peplus]|nr:hypothetical protein M5689_014571 [Euphorbia peplus]